MTSDEKSGIVKLSLMKKGSYSSVSVAARAPKNTGYSRKCTEAKTEQPIITQTINIAIEPSIDFLPSRPNRLTTASPPNDTPITAADMSPSTKNKMDAIEIDGGEIAMHKVQPSEK